MTLTPVSPGRIRRLPLVDRPFARETLESFVSRLAALNYRPLGDLTLLLIGKDQFPRRVRHREIAMSVRDKLALLTGYAPGQLARTFPVPEEADHNRPERISSRSELRHIDARRPGYPRPACVSCAASRRPGGAWIQQWPTHTQRACLRHYRWIGPPGRTISTEQLDLRTAPEVTQAVRRHLRMVRRHGPDANIAVSLAETHIVTHNERNQVQPHIRKRVERLLHNNNFSRGLGYFPHEDIAYAAAYPEAVALAWLVLNEQYRRTWPDAIPRYAEGIFGHILNQVWESSRELPRSPEPVLLQRWLYGDWLPKHGHHALSALP
ncbi:TniQ family protein [Amycolatopsis rubida]|uniref:TniQ protein n=1 Tax=Amycolatopsis rubida TaxID=112413 RepID=A0A1I5X5N3_9PSEU|nr:TniQ family protein [Amycolatopsis rubida]SFQ27191.1 TniQ protein [Amycolatopsis rubida]